MNLIYSFFLLRKNLFNAYLSSGYLTMISLAACPQCHANTSSWLMALATSSGAGVVKMTIWRIVSKPMVCIFHDIRQMLRATKCWRTKKKRPIRRGESKMLLLFIQNN